MPAEEGNQNAAIHGGTSGVYSLQKGTPLQGLAAKEEQRVLHDYADRGRLAMLEEQAVRLHAVSALYWNAVGMVVERAQQGDREALGLLDSHAKRFGWLAGQAVRAWKEVREEEERTGAGVIDYEKMLEEGSGGGT